MEVITHSGKVEGLCSYGLVGTILQQRSRGPPNIGPVKLARFLAEISMRARGTDELPTDLISTLLSAVQANADNAEGRALAKACLALIECEGEISEEDLLTLGRDSLLLIDRFAAERLRLRYKREDLELLTRMLRELVEVD